MPFASQAQQRFAFGTGQPWAKRWADETDFSKLPKRVRRIRSKRVKGCTCGESYKGEQIAPGITRIRGNLCNVHGKYGPCDAAQSGGKKPRGGKGRGRAAAKPKKTDQQRAAERDAKRSQNAASVAQQMAANDTGLSPAGSKALLAFATGEQPDAQAAEGFVKMGLAEQAADGSYRMTPTGRAVVNAMQAGDYQRAVDGISRATDAASARRGRQSAAAQRRQDTAGRRAQAQMDRELRKREAEQRRAARAAAAKKPASGGGGSRKKPAAEAAPTKRTQRLDARRGGGKVGGTSPVGGASSSGGGKKPAQAAQPKPEKPTIAPELQAAVTALSEGKDLAPADLLNLIRNGLAKIDKDGIPVLTAAGQRATLKSRRARRIALKEQTPQQRAMFARMGSSGGGGGGGGGGGKGAGGGGSQLWPKGPSGKRTPQAAAAETRTHAGQRQLPGTGAEFHGKRTPSSSEGQARPADAGKPAHGQTVGNVTKAYGADPNTSYTLRHELVDMGDIQASNTKGGAINPKYDPSLQPRDRSRASSQAQIAQVAQNMNPEVMTTDFHRIDAGTPIIDKNGNVLSGNGRTLALQRAAEHHPDKYDAYREQIKAEARAAGIDPAAVDRMKNPVLVRRLEGDHDPAAFAREANSSGTLRMSPLEQAKVDAGQINDHHMLKLHVTEGQDIDRALRDKANKPFIDEFLKDIPDNERANLLTRNGELNQMGLYRAKAAIYTRAFPGAAGERMAESMLESLDPDIKTVQNGISGGLPAFSRATALTRSGLRDPELDISHDLAKTVDVYARIKDNPHLTANTPAHQVVAKYLGQSSMFDRELNDDQERLLVHIDKISRKPTEVRGFMERYARLVESAPQPGQSSLFGEGHRMTRAQLLDQLLGDTQVPEVQAQTGMF